MEKLFIGGCADGKRLVVPSMPYHKAGDDTYRLERFVISNPGLPAFFDIYIADTINTKEAFQLLLTHYRPKP